MNIFHYYYYALKSYFKNKYLFFSLLITIFFIYFLDIFLKFFIYFENFNLIFWHFVNPFFIYISMVFVVSAYYYKAMPKYKLLRQLFFKILFQELFIIISKLVWNFFKVILIESDIIIVHENSHLYPIFFLAFFWYIIYAAESYIIKKILLPHTKKLKSFFHYVIDQFWTILIHLLCACIFSFLFILIISFICVKIQNVFTILLTPQIHHFIEKILEISFYVYFNHLVAFFFAYSAVQEMKVKK